MFDTLVFIVRTLDSLPDLFRAALGAAVLAALIHRVSQEIPERLAGLAAAHRKTSLVVLLLVPFLIFAIPTFRFDITVAEMPEPFTLPNLIVWPLLVIWLLGTVGHAGRAGLKARHELAGAHALEPAGEPLCESVDHWRTRLRLSRTVELRLSGTDRPFVTGWREPIIVLPRAASHWPKAVVDALIVQSLCHVKKRHWPWLAFGTFVGAAYWPFPWIARLTTQLGCAFQERADSLAMACFADTSGYVRALQHVRQRLTPPTVQRAPDDDPPLLIWGDAESITHRETQAQRADGDPHYDRIFWAMVQVTLAALLIAGPTLTEPPPEIEYEPASDTWQQVIHRSPEMVDMPIKKRR